MTANLLSRQVKLLGYLTSGAVIFGDESEAPLDRALSGMDPDMLRLEAGLSHEKRLSKIASILPRTFELLGSGWSAIAREFADACPPTSIGFIDSARQFHGFLCSLGEREPPMPPYLHEVAACELSLAEARIFARPPDDRAVMSDRSGSNRVRRRSGVNLLRCTYDVRPIFTAGAVKAIPSRCDRQLAITMIPGADHPTIFELTPAAFDLLVAINDWFDCTAPDMPSELKELIGELTECGLVQVEGGIARDDEHR